jgi:chromosome segregation ATPase
MRGMRVTGGVDMRCERCGAYDWTQGQDKFKSGHYRPDGRYCLGADQRQQIITLQEKVKLECLWNEQLWSMIQSLEKENESLRRELLERAEAHEEAERKVQVAESKHSWLWKIIEDVSSGDARLLRENAALRRELNSIVESAFDTMTRNCHLRQELLERAQAHEDAEVRIQNLEKQNQSLRQELFRRSYGEYPT